MTSFAAATSSSGRWTPSAGVAEEVDAVRCGGLGSSPIHEASTSTVTATIAGTPIRALTYDLLISRIWRGFA